MKKNGLLILLLLAEFALSAETDGDLARLYTDEAFYYFARENYDLAERYTGEALKFSPGLADSWYLKGMITEHQGDRFGAMGYYRKSIDLTSVFTDYFYDLYYRYLNLLNITEKYGEVISFFKENRDIFQRDDEILLKVADSAFRYGLIDYSSELAGQVYGRNPYNLKALLFLLRSDKKRNYIDQIEKAMHNLKIDSLDEVIFQSLILGAPDQKSEKLLSLYKKIFGNTDFYYLKTDPTDPAVNQSRNLMIRSSGKENLDTGVYFGDNNFDGISDEIVTVTSEEMTYLLDGNQDNVTDLSINFNEGLPVNIYVNSEGKGFEFLYSDYPYLSEVRTYQGERKRSYRIYPGTDYTPLTGLESFSWKYNEDRNILTEGFFLSEPELFDLSYLMVEYFPGSDDIFREYSMEKGEVRGIKEDSRRSGKFDYYLDIAAWLPEAGRKDLNSDGLIDMFEYYDNGKIQGIALDWNNNGRPEYIEDWSLLNVKSWDFDEDLNPDGEYIASSDEIPLYSYPVSGKSDTPAHLYFWNFKDENFWFINN